MKKHPNIPESAWRFLMRLTRTQSIDSLILFGSRAFGDHDDRSDVDVAVCGESITRLELARMKDAASVADSLYWISLVHLERNPPALRKRITETGVSIYVRPQTPR